MQKDGSNPRALKKLSPEFRRERDALGEISVPKNALYGAQTARAIENFSISQKPIHPAMLQAFLILKRATATANAQLGVLAQEHRDLIYRAVDDLLKLSPESWRETFPVDAFQAGAGTSTHMNVNEVIANVGNLIAGKDLGSYSPLHPNDHVNRSQSTNDTFPTAMRIALLERSRDLIVELTSLSVSFERRARLFMPILKSARTHLQDAVPIRLGQEFRAYAGTLSKCVRTIETARQELLELGIGGSAAGTGINVPDGFSERVARELNRLTGHSFRVAADLIESMQSQSAIAGYSSSLKLLALQGTRICNDLRLLASGPLTGLSELILPAVQPGSSIMPGKVNPSILEMANQSWFAVLGRDHTVSLAIQAGQLELNVMMPVMADSLLEATDLATTTLRALRTKVVDGIEPNLEQLRKYFESTPQIATALTPKLGYAKTAELVKQALVERKSILELVRSQKLLTEDEVGELLDPDRLT